MRNIEVKPSLPFPIKAETGELNGSTSKIFSSLLTQPTFGSRLPQWTPHECNETEFKSIKANPLVENNVKFGSSPLIRPTILEKPTIMVPAASVDAEREKTQTPKMLESVPLSVTSKEAVATVVSASVEKETKDSARETKEAKALSKETKEAKIPTKDAKEAKAPKESKSKVMVASAATILAPESTTNTAETASKKPQPNESEDTGRLRLRKKERNESPAAPAPVVSAAEPPKRQRIDLKGPRVKHVCRSASIVLGQPMATFGDETPMPEMDTPPRPDSPSNVLMELHQTTAVAAQQKHVAAKQIEANKQADVECADSTRLSPPATPITHDSESDNATARDMADDELPSEVPAKIEEIATKKQDEHAKPITRKVTRPANVNAVAKKEHKQQVKAPPTISIDFWENYDPAEVSQNGFGLIVSEDFPLKALCFLCGSCGQEPLIYCVCCCEPYHQYCVEDSYNMKHTSLDDTSLSLMDTSIDGGPTSQLINRLNWMCPRCTVCEMCNMASGSKVKCQKCQKNYHSTCLGTSKRPLGADRPLICSKCLKCKRCGSAHVYKFVGNMPMCTTCFRRRQDKNFCPLCQKFYDESDYNLKMMECGTCRHWVHAKCEGLNDEQYNMLSVLPENIEFICRKCNPGDSTVCNWRDAVTAEFQASLMSIIKWLSKSRQACALLRLSPRKKSNRCTCNARASAIRTISFDDEREEATRSDDDSLEALTSDKDDSSATSSRMKRPTQCFCGAAQKQTQNTSQSFFDIKLKVTANKYFSLADFNYDMNQVIGGAECEELLIAYKEILCETFPWFQNDTKACTDALEEDMYDSCFGQDHGEDIECDQQVPLVNIPDDIDTMFFPPSVDKDTRCCALCKGVGDGQSNEESRMLYCGQNVWVHANCAMWSAEVFEEIDGSLQKVHSAVSRGRLIKCSDCGQKGATVGCNARNCSEQYHFACARKSNCAFMVDKKVFCPKHRNNIYFDPIKQESNFEVVRAVYVELDRRKRKGVEPTSVQFIKGSLHVRKLGRFVAKLSDLVDAIVPAGFVCDRRFWSTKEPWRMTQYTFRTYVQNDFSSAFDCGRNFTVDHSTSMAQLGIAQIAKWHSNLSNGDNDHDNSHLTRQERSMRQLMSAGHSEETNEDEPQNNTDLLPPEIKDAIFEDLPHDILDGISMLDIFPKLGNWDLGTMDSKTEAYLNGDILKDANMTDDDLSQNSQKDFDDNQWMNSNMHVEDALLSATRSIPNAQSFGRELKRNKSEMCPRNNLSGIRSQQQQRSSLNVKGKSDVSATTTLATAKRRKMSMLDLPESVLLSLRIRKDDGPSSTIQSDEIKNKPFTWSAAKTLANLESTSSDAQCSERATTFASKDMLDRLKISQLDGMDDISSSSDGGSPAQEYTIYTSTGQIESPVKCDRCHCAYRTQESFNRHLQTCEAMSTSESDSELTSRTPDMQSPQQVPSNMVITSINGSEYCNIAMLQQSAQQQAQPIYSFNGATLAQMSQGMPLQNQMSVQAVQNNGMSMPMIINPNGTIQQQQYAQPLTLGSIGQQLFPLQMQATTANTQPQITQFATPHIQIASAQHHQHQQQTIVQKGKKTKKVAMPVMRTNKPIQMKKTQNARIEPAKPTVQVLNQNMPMIRTINGLDGNMVIQSTNQAQQPLIMQQLAPSTQNNIMQYVAASDGNNGLQYFAMPTTTAEYKPQSTQYLGTNQLMPGTFQLQSDASGNLVLANTSTGLQVIPNGNGLQLAQTAQPQVFGTLIQPQTAAIQCGMMGNEQMVLGTTPTYEMVTNPATGCMLLANQPMYYGLETIVQNTVMQSQQFVSTAMQGVLSQNSSYSATTTQVFQASKIEPLMDMAGGYVVLNNDGTLMQPTQQQLLAANLIQPTVSAIQAQPNQMQQPQIQAATSAANWRFIDDKSVATQSIQQQPIIQQQLQVQPQIMQSPKPVIKSAPMVVNKIHPQPKLITSTASNPTTTIIVNQPKTSPVILPKPAPIINTIDVGQFTIQQSNAIISESSIATNGSCTITTAQPANLMQKKPNILKPIGSGVKITSATIKPKIISKPVHVTPKPAKPSTFVGKDVLPLSNNPQVITVTATEVPTSRSNTQNPITVYSQQSSSAHNPNGFKSPSITIQQVSDDALIPRSIKDITIDINEDTHKFVSPAQYLPKISEQVSNQISITPIPLSSSMSIIPTITQSQQPSQSLQQSSPQTVTSSASHGYLVTSSIQLPQAPYAPSFSNGE